MTTELRRASAPDTPQFQAELGRWVAASTRQSTRLAGRVGRRRGLCGSIPASVRRISSTVHRCGSDS